MRTLLAVWLLCSCVIFAQEAPEKGGHEVQIWFGGGHSVSGGTRNTSVVNGGLRYGWVLTALHGPGFLKGNFEYTVDAVPLFLVFQPANTAYGFGLNPLGLKWNFVPRGSIVPYFELGGGTLFSTHNIPTGTSSTNFTTTAALGFHHIGHKITWSLDARYMHISNAGLATPNPGINTFQVRIGFGKFGKK
jgi:lipid A 3-O-deacylase